MRTPGTEGRCGRKTSTTAGLLSALSVMQGIATPQRVQERLEPKAGKERATEGRATEGRGSAAPHLGCFGRDAIGQCGLRTDFDGLARCLQSRAAQLTEHSAALLEKCSDCVPQLLKISVSTLDFLGGLRTQKEIILFT